MTSTGLKRINRFNWVCLLPALWMTACAATGDIAYQPVVEDVAVERIPIKVKLRLTPEFRATAVEGRFSRSFRWTVGEALSQHAEALSRALFAEVVVDGQNDDPSGVDATLTPAVEVNYSVPVVAFTSALVTCKLTWTMTDGSGARIWHEQVVGAATGTWGLAYGWTSELREFLEQAVGDAINQSVRQMRDTDKIRAFASRRT